MVKLTYNPSSASNATSSFNDDGTQQVSGPFVFWAIIALALNAMGQTSISTDLAYGTDHLFSGGLTPQLSSPIICAMDVVIESGLLLTCLWKKLWLVIRATISGAASKATLSVTEAGHAPAIHELVGIRAVLFVFAVLPPAVKVFSMSGVPVTQAIVATYLAAPLLRTASLLVGDEMNRQKEALFALCRPDSVGEQTLHDSKTDASLEETASGAESTKSMALKLHWYHLRGLESLLLSLGRRLSSIVDLSLWMLHVPAYFILWLPFEWSANYKISGHVQLVEDSQPLLLLDLVLQVMQLVLIALACIWALVPLVIGRWPLHVRWWPQKPPLLGQPLLAWISFSLRKRMELRRLEDAEIQMDLGIATAAAFFSGPWTVVLICTLLLELSVHSVGTVFRRTKVEDEEFAAVVTAEESSTSRPKRPGDIHVPFFEDDPLTAESLWPFEIAWINERQPFRYMFGLGLVCLWRPVVVRASAVVTEDKKESERLYAMYGGKMYWDSAVRTFWRFVRSIPPALKDAWFYGQQATVSESTGNGGGFGNTSGDLRLSSDADGYKSAPSIAKRVLNMAITLTWAVILLTVQIPFQAFVPCIYIFNPFPYFRFVNRLTGHLRRPRRFWLCFAIFNCLTALQFCMLTWNGEGTVNPPWTAFLG